MTDVKIEQSSPFTQYIEDLPHPSYFCIPNTNNWYALAEGDGHTAIFTDKVAAFSIRDCKIVYIKHGTRVQRAHTFTYKFVT